MQKASAGPTAARLRFEAKKNDNWEGGYRVPLLVRWPGKIDPGTQVNEIVSHLDWFPTIAAAVGDDDIKEQLKEGTRFGKKKFKVHLDGYNSTALHRGRN